jgi:hypothetical protein
VGSCRNGSAGFSITGRCACGTVCRPRPSRTEPRSSCRCPASDLPAGISSVAGSCACPVFALVPLFGTTRFSTHGAGRPFRKRVSCDSSSGRNDSFLPVCSFVLAASADGGESSRIGSTRLRQVVEFLSLYDGTSSPCRSAMVFCVPQALSLGLLSRCASTHPEERRRNEISAGDACGWCGRPGGWLGVEWMVFTGFSGDGLGSVGGCESDVSVRGIPDETAMPRCGCRSRWQACSSSPRGWRPLKVDRRVTSSSEPTTRTGLA